MKLFNDKLKGWAENTEDMINVILIALCILGVWNTILTVLVFAL